ncbi:hypothetical protein A2755_03815 [Candidatus Wolfebacteria bacterium RIFCSPHIGHO2_01_FULL_48_22]|uniref:Uncharacterized protein n=2 Tax=Candidatus Wolfeibacteriota TaxID=1752735 RepID=A0A1F8DQP8_9BACT|nr:MAG: hypothetical protein A2755_03815 [Candidatus Wolfebacteria bacterium RIFCSPHIGHO2_01_FULL_48_22]OGM93466.1 MAG: hypothetical protein A2935_01165 [Candidatus Wolfebacteria bacterium RIFCSPLOWO2_01_FULL_47_17b]
MVIWGSFDHHLGEVYALYMKNFENPYPNIKEGKDRENFDTKVPAELTEVGKANVDPDAELEKEQIEKLKQNRRQEFRTQEGITAEQAYDPTDEMDEKLDAEMEKEIGDVDEVIGPDGMNPPRPTYFPPEEWDALSREERIAEYRKRDAEKMTQRKAEEKYAQHPVRRFVRKIFKKDQAA